MTNSKQTRKALYSSVLSLLLCFVMLIGTTFAWFTDTASTSVNKIQAGKLEVALQMKNADGKWVSADGETLKFTENYWEPGCTYSLPELRIVNEGNLALKYKVAITGIKGDADLNKVIDWTISGVVLGHEYTLAADATQNFTISGHMQEAAGNEYQNKKIENIAITVYATQATVEVDGTGKDTYDKDATYDDGTTTTPVPDNKVKTLDALKEAIANKESVIELGANIELDGQLTFDTVTINGNGHTLTNAAVRVGSGSAINNVVFDNPVSINNEASNLYCTGSLIVNNCTFKNTQWDAIQVVPAAGDTVTINGCTFTANSSGAERFIHVEVNDSTCSTNVNVNITNNNFGSSDNLSQDIIGIYGINENGINYGGNNTFADKKGVVWVGWLPNIYADSQSDVYSKLIGSGK